MKVVLADILSYSIDRNIFRIFARKNGINLSNRRIGCALYTEVRIDDLEKWCEAYLEGLSYRQYRHYSNEYGMKRIYPKIKAFLQSQKG